MPGLASLSEDYCTASYDNASGASKGISSLLTNMFYLCWTSFAFKSCWVSKNDIRLEVLWLVFVLLLLLLPTYPSSRKERLQVLMKFLKDRPLVIATSALLHEN